MFRCGFPCWLLACGLWIWFSSGPSNAAENDEQSAASSDDAKSVEFFESRIRPALIEHCFPCHSAESKTEGGLALDTREGVRRGGDRGPAIVPGDPDQSLLLTAISHKDENLRMPPRKKKLSSAVISDFQAWIKSGAVDPRDASNVIKPVPGADLESSRRFWSWQKPHSQSIPATMNPEWARRRLDHFILHKLEIAGLSPTLPASQDVLIRRLHFDLIGLPPTVTVSEEFGQRVKFQGLEAALEHEVEALLASPHFGERWGRHWLDLARFAESSGKESNISFPYAWRYRDYVIDALNQDIPYDRFLMEQIAGDLLPAKDSHERARLLIATGFLAVGPKNLDESNSRQFAADVVDEQIDALTRSVVANSVACARCHDHKFDPFTMRDYYALAGIFASTKTYFGTFVSPANQVGGDPLVLPTGIGLKIFHDSIPPARVTALKAELIKLKREHEEGMAAAQKAVQSGDDPEKVFTLRDALRIFWTTGGIEGQIEKVDEQGNALPLAMGVLDRDKIQNSHLYERGEITRPSSLVPRGMPEIFRVPELETLPKSQSGRIELASWLTHRDQPLTGRVFVNRVWKHLFGKGLVATTDNFGMSGERPSHPELLDDLTVKFIRDGWSLKKLIREIVLSSTYRQGSTYDVAAFKVDPDNRLLWRMSKRRLDAEAIRDAMLAVSGEISLKPLEGSLVATSIGDRPISLIGLDSKIPSDLDHSTHRSVYLPVLRDRLPDVLNLFDFAEPSLVIGDRETTNVPLQALYLMNSPFVMARSQGLARRLMAWNGTKESRIILAFQLCFGRTPDSTELKLCEAYLITPGAPEINDTKLKEQRFGSLCQSLLSIAEFRNLD